MRKEKKSGVNEGFVCHKACSCVKKRTSRVLWRRKQCVQAEKKKRSVSTALPGTHNPNPWTNSICERCAAIPVSLTFPRTACRSVRTQCSRDPGPHNHNNAILTQATQGSCVSLSRTHTRINTHAQVPETFSASVSLPLPLAQHAHLYRSTPVNFGDVGDDTRGRHGEPGLDDVTVNCARRERNQSRGYLRCWE